MTLDPRSEDYLRYMESCTGFKHVHTPHISELKQMESISVVEVEGSPSLLHPLIKPKYDSNFNEMKELKNICENVDKNPVPEGAGLAYALRFAYNEENGGFAQASIPEIKPESRVTSSTGKKHRFAGILESKKPEPEVDRGPMIPMHGNDQDGGLYLG